VHLALWPVGEELLDRGVVAVVEVRAAVGQ